jgi:hypothetical protein
MVSTGQNVLEYAEPHLVLRLSSLPAAAAAELERLLVAIFLSTSFVARQRWPFAIDTSDRFRGWWSEGIHVAKIGRELSNEWRMKDYYTPIISRPMRRPLLI